MSTKQKKIKNPFVGTPKLTIRKKTKIVATIGPGTTSEKMMTALVRAGMNVMRLNFSHGDHDEHRERIEIARKVSKKEGRAIAIIQDLAGPKIRIGDFYKERVHLKKGSEFVLSTEQMTGDENGVYVNYAHLPREVKKGDRILLDDGKKELKVLKTGKKTVTCRVVVGGETKGRRGVNLPGVHLKISALTAKDKKDLAFGLAQGVDYMALSFVRDVKDIKDLRNILRHHGAHVGILAKIETAQAIDHIDEIIDAADGIMVARGDLAIEVPPQDVPILQKKIIQRCNIAGKPVITATQMLESMISSPVPTRAEVSDVANSILDGTDAVMLSEETTLGSYPLQAVTMMTHVAARVEAMSRRGRLDNYADLRDVVDAVTYTVPTVADEVGAKAIVALTESGSTARMVSRFRPKQPIILMSPNKRTRAKGALYFGCYCVSIPTVHHISDVTELVNDYMLHNKIAARGEKVVIVAGVPFGHEGGTNMVLVHTVS